MKKRILEGFRVLAIAIFFGAALQACKKESLLTTGGAISYSADTLSFDTVFTAQGSFTQGIKIFNKENRSINLSSVRLAAGEASFFTLNVDGRPGKTVSNISIAANDSIYVFATVNVDPTAENMPFLITDELVATLNGADFSLPLVAYGQNAYYITDSVLGTATWLTDKPYLIIHNAAVDAGATLTIPAGARIYMHADSRLYVLGTLLAAGTKEDSIIFQGDRLDRGYFGNRGFPGEWGGLYFDSHSSGSVLTHVILKNGGAATQLGGSALSPALIQVSPDSTGSAAPQLYLDRCVIRNSIGYGLLTFAAHVRADNCLITECGAQAVAIFQGGRDTFNNCTITGYGTRDLNHSKYPAVAALNYLGLGNEQYLYGPLQALFRNCVIFGSLDDEFIPDNKPGAGYELRLDHCDIKRTEALPGYVAQASTAVQINADPAFMNTAEGDYHLQSGSALKDAGVQLAGITNQDLDDKPRTDPPDIGCYEAD